MKKYSLYLFDFDGTLFDTLESLIPIYRKTFKHFGVDCTLAECEVFLGLSLPRTLRYKGLDPKCEQEFIDVFHQFVHCAEVEKATKLYPETLATFKYLHTHHIKYGIVTGSSSRRVKGIMKHFKIDDKKMLTMVGNDTYHRPKPDPEPILIALEQTGFLEKKDEVVFVGDSDQDVKCAKAAGVDPIIVKRSNNKKHDIESLLDLFA